LAPVPGEKSPRFQDSWDYCPWSLGYQMGWCFFGFAFAVPMKVLISIGRINEVLGNMKISARGVFRLCEIGIPE